MKSKKDVKDVIFILSPNRKWILKEHYPVPADKEIPEWYKSMPPYIDKTNIVSSADTQTMKRCMPVFDVLTAGYLIKTYTDIMIEKTKDGKTRWAWSYEENNDKPIETHPAFQTVNYKNTGIMSELPKFSNPWGIQTPKGYSCLFMHPTHRPDYGAKILEGIVDTDLYNAPVHFPAIFDEGFEGLIPAGTCIAQVIPFKRDVFEMSIGDEEDELKIHNSTIEVRTRFLNGYRNKLRQKKEYR